MPTFEYEARNREGRQVRGHRVAPSASLLGAQLLREGITPVHITAAHETTERGLWLRKILSLDSVSADEMAMFARQMHTLLKTGVPVTFALRQLAENTRNPLMTHALTGMVTQLESGREIAAAMREYPAIFTPVMTSMIRTGEATGQLDEAFLRLNEYLELESSAIQKTRAALRYPGFVLLALIAAFFTVTGWVIPTFARIFGEQHMQLPLVTRILIGLSDGMKAYGLWLLPVLGAAAGGLIWWLKTPAGKYRFGRFMLGIPFVGKILRRIILLRFAQAFYIVASSGVSLLEGIRLSAGTTDNAWAREEILSLGQSVERGMTLTRAVAASPLFTTLEIQMLGISEETGDLARMLAQIAIYYRREVEYDIKRLADMIEPMVMGVLALLVALLAFSVYLPIWNMVTLAKT